MPADSTPTTTGVYAIRCIPTNRIYIGSAVNLRARWQNHRNALRKSRHRNFLLQRAWKKYGEGQFELSVLEYSTRTELLRKEQFWIDKTKCTERRKGYNLCTVAGSPGGRARTWKGFKDPAGKPRTIRNLHDFCRRNGLSASAMVALANPKHKLKSHKGWTHEDSVRIRDYVKTYTGFIDTQGHRVDAITNLAEFCRRNGLDKTHMIAVKSGRICSHRGWTHTSSRPRRNHKTYYGFINPAGERTIITNLQAHCRRHGLSPVHMHNLKSGVRKFHKGWIWKPGNEAYG